MPGLGGRHLVHCDRSRPDRPVGRGRGSARGVRRHRGGGEYRRAGRAGRRSGDWAGAAKLLLLGAVLHRRRRTRLARKLKAVGQEIIELTNAKVATGADRETARTTVQATHRLAERARWEAATARYPTNEVPVRPTASGNLLAALRQRADQHLGLDLVVVWGPLLDVLPQQQRTRLTERSTAVLRLFEPVIPTLVLAFAASLIPSWPPAVAWIGGCVVLSATLYIRAVRGVRRYVDDVENTLVIHRAPLFRACGLLPPVDTAGEVRAGQQLSQYFWWVRRGTPRPELDFTWMSSKTDASSDTHADVAS